MFKWLFVVENSMIQVNYCDRFGVNWDPMTKPNQRNGRLTSTANQNQFSLGWLFIGVFAFAILFSFARIFVDATDAYQFLFFYALSVIGYLTICLLFASK